MSETRLLSCSGLRLWCLGEGREEIRLGWVRDDMVLTSVRVCVVTGLGPGLWGVPGKGVTSGAGYTQVMWWQH